MKNTLSDLNNHLFAQLERLSDEDIKGEKLIEEISRAKAVNEVATRIINNGSLVLDAKKWWDDRWNADAKLPEMLEGDIAIGAPKEKKKMPKKQERNF